MLEIIIVITVILVVIGATQRKKLAVIFKSNTNAVVDVLKDPIKILKLKISEAKEKLNTIIDQAAKLYAQEEAIKRTVETLTSKITKAKNKLREFNKDPETNKDKIQAKALLIVSLNKELEEVNLQLADIKANRKKLEGLVEKQKSFINRMEARLVTVESRQATTSVYENIGELVSEFEEDSMPNLEEDSKKDLDAASKKLEYLEGEEELPTELSPEEIEALLE